MSEEKGQQLPVGWASCVLEDVAEIVRGVAFPKEAKGLSTDEGVVACLRTTNVQAHVEWDDLWWIPEVYVRRAEQIVRQGDILISVANSYELVGKVALAAVPPVRATLGAFIALIRACTPIDSRFLYYLLASSHVQAAIRSVASTTTNISNVNTTKVRATTLSIAPLREQTRIGDVLDEFLSDLDAGVAALERVQSKLKRYRAAVLKTAVEGALTAHWRVQHPDIEPASALLQRILAERRCRWEDAQLEKFKAAGKEPPKNWKANYKEAVVPDASNLPTLPEGWCWASLDQVSYFVTSGSRGWAEYYSEEGAMFVRSQDIRTDKLLLNDVARVTPPQSSEGARTRLQRGDLLITITGANVAKAALVDFDLEEAYVSQHVGMVRFVDSKFGAFVHVYATAPSGGRKVLLTVAYGAGKPGLNLDNLRGLAIPVPPTAEQEAIVEAVEDQLSIVEHLESDLGTKLKSAQALHQSIMRHAFTGQLVPQDPNDEPASGLLKQIAVEREERARLSAAAKEANKKPRPARAAKTEMPRKRAATKIYAKDLS